MSDNVLISLATPLIALASLIFTGIINYQMARLKSQQAIQLDQADEAAVRVEEVRDTLAAATLDRDEKFDEADKKIDDLSRVSHATHKLVNGNMAAQLHLNRVTSRRLAEYTHDPIDIEAAALANTIFKTHMRKQAQSEGHEYVEEHKGPTVGT